MRTATLEQYEDFKFLIIEKMKTNSISTFFDLVKLAQENNRFKELSTLLNICATFQAVSSSSDCEGGFSVMNSIKSKLRNRLKIDNLEYLMRITTYIASGGNINLDSVYEHWVNNKDRRQKY